MPQGTSPEATGLLLSLLQWLGLGSLAGLLAWRYLPPRLTITEVRNKHPQHSFESRLAVKNIGQLPAYDIWANLYAMNAILGASNTVSVEAMTRCGPPVARLDAHETMEIPVIPGIGMPPGSPVASCRHTVELEYHTGLPFFRKPFTRRWTLELRRFQDGFTWHFTPQ